LQCGAAGCVPDGLRIADASIMPRVATGNAMAQCVVIGEQAAAFFKP
jgi:choline dehydrogenase